MVQIIRLHSIVLILCSLIGFIGHFLQFGVARITPWIPASVGMILMFFTLVPNKKIARYLSFFLIVSFGILVTNMLFTFWNQDFQPIRKKLIFLAMSLSSWVSILVFILKKKFRH
ncbi:hypothetical protein DX873_04680 [Flagellimonas nanhaiensis]|uniref:Uncharacterized protein n=1 Tax=Flagellimonas nanhaiensis TaxID=2292706 RepID=A0A371JUH7_9FLAO|nr:hypothetical protein DX873_04680 [Allomuricauda nanhaiensis]